jgi:hypothetical protein
MVRPSPATSATPVLVPIDDPRIRLAPYVWKRSGSGAGARIEATMPGAYLRAAFTGARSLAIRIDRSANQGCPPQSMPVVEWSLDEQAFRVAEVAPDGGMLSLTLGEDLDPEVEHRVEFWFRAADLDMSRFTSPIAHLRLAGLELAAGGRLVEHAVRPGRALFFGDSITEGVGVDGLFTGYQHLAVNNARCTWPALVAAALDCEYGQLGSGGFGMCVRIRNHRDEIQMPPLPETWDRYDHATSRLVGGRLLPEPDHVFCQVGTNDQGLVITDAYVAWLAAVRAACPDTRIFCVAYSLFGHGEEVAAAVAARRAAGDARVHLIDIAPLRPLIGYGTTAYTYDRVHPGQFGEAFLGSFIAAQAGRILGGRDGG